MEFGQLYFGKLQRVATLDTSIYFEYFTTTKVKLEITLRHLSVLLYNPLLMMKPEREKKRRYYPRRRKPHVSNYFELHKHLIESIRIYISGCMGLEVLETGVSSLHEDHIPDRILWCVITGIISIMWLWFVDNNQMCLAEGRHDAPIPLYCGVQIIFFAISIFLFAGSITLFVIDLFMSLKVRRNVTSVDRKKIRREKKNYKDKLEG